MDIEELKNQKQELNKPDKFYFKGQPEFSPSLVGMPSFVHYSCYVDLKQVLTNAINVAESLQSELTKVKEERDSLKCCGNCANEGIFTDKCDNCNYNTECYSPVAADYWEGNK